MKRTTTKIDEDILSEVREFTKANGYSLVWFLNEAAKDKLKQMKQIKKYVQVQSEYVASMGNYLMDKTKKKKK